MPAATVQNTSKHTVPKYKNIGQIILDTPKKEKGCFRPNMRKQPFFREHPRPQTAKPETYL